MALRASGILLVALGLGVVGMRAIVHVPDHEGAAATAGGLSGVDAANGMTDTEPPGAGSPGSEPDKRTP